MWNQLRVRAACGAFAIGALTSACDFQGRMSLAEMRDALVESVVQGQARTMENDIVEITTTFTIGAAVEDILEEVRAWAETQAPCTTVSLEDQTLTIDFGGLDDDCTYNGRTYAGVIQSSFEVLGDEVLVHHEYTGFSNGEITLDGNADVTWGGGARNVVTDLHFETDDRTLDVQADRTQTLLDPEAGLAGGIEIDGYRDWQGQAGDWHLDINEVEVRGEDPVPQDGSYVLETPQSKELTLTFERVDEDTIEVRLIAPNRERIYHVTKGGGVSDEGDA
jgi:hypothetical protein